MKNLKQKINSLIYKRKFYSTSLRSIEKRKVFGFTVLKRIVTEAGTDTIYLKLLHIKKNNAETHGGHTMPFNRFDLADLPQDVAENAPLVSVIVPNYNHASYLRERLESIYWQTYPHMEVILLDDASTDNSTDVLKEYATRYSDNTRLVINETNCGKVFLQWNKGLSLARGTYVWIAESDDYCDPNFLQETVKGLSHPSVMVSFARSVFMQEGKQVGCQEKYLEDVPVSWSTPFIMTAHDLVRKAFAIKNVIPNVSGAVFRNIGRIPDEVTDLWKELSLCGDWLFYLWLIRGGSVSYTPRATNYYRIHPASTSLRVQKTLDYYRETFRISCCVARWYKVDCSLFNIVKENLRHHYMSFQCTSSAEPVEQIYDIGHIEQLQASRLPNIAICGAALTQGGGEIFPIYLANALKELGASVTFLDFRTAPYDENIRKKLDVRVPLIELSSIAYLPDILEYLGTEIIHTHEGGIDRSVGKCLKRNKHNGCKHIVTLHGMYEAINKQELDSILQEVLPGCSAFVYIADKNLKPLQDLLPRLRLYKIGNGLPELPIAPLQREELGIEPEAFCITLASRAILEKGWKEAIMAVEQVHANLARPIHLILLGDGKCYDELKKDKNMPPYIHIEGRKGNVRSYFAMSDIGLLPSCFKGESFPLVVIESLISNTPVLATDVGEIRNMLTDDSGKMAGVVFGLNEGKVPVDMLARHIRELATNESLYRQLKANIPAVIRKFDIRHTATQYLHVYEEALQNH